MILLHFFLIALLTPVFPQVYANVFLSDYAIKSPESEDLFEFKSSYAQSDLTENLSALDTDQVRDHPLGIEVAKRIHLLEERYTVLTDAAPGSFSGQKTVQKADIYNSIYKIIKYYKKLTRKNLIDRAQAIEELCHYLDLILIIRYENTLSFEKALKEAGSEKDIIRLFDSVVIY